MRTNFTILNRQLKQHNKINRFNQDRFGFNLSLFFVGFIMGFSLQDDNELKLKFKLHDNN